MPILTANTNGKIKPNIKKVSPFAGRSIVNYRRPMGRWMYHPALRDGRFTRRDVPAMIQDSAVSIGLYTIYGPLFGAQWEVRANSPEIKTFVENTLYRFWHHDLMKILPGYVMNGTAVAEVLYEKDPETGYWKFAGLDDFDMNDVQALTPIDRPRHLTGAKVSYGSTFMVGPYLQKSPTAVNGQDGQVSVKEWNTLRHPKIFWCAHQPLFGDLWGRSVMEAAWPSWMEKVGAHGAISIRRLWAFSNAFRGCLVKYPPGSTNVNGVQIENQDIARELAENYCTGGALFCPSGVDQETKTPLWEIVDPKLNGEVKGLMEYPDNLDKKIWQGMSIPDEVLTAPETGGSWSGRSGPLLIFLNISDMRVRELITAFDVGPSGYTTRNDQAGGVIRSLVMENFGPKAKYEIRPISLVPKPPAPPGGAPGGAPPPGMPADAGAPPGAGGPPPEPPPQPVPSPMGPPPGPQAMGGPPAPMAGRPISLSGAEVVELPDADVEAILAGENVALSAAEDLAGRIAKACADVDPHPSDESKAAGNYRKGHCIIQGLPVTLESARGHTRRGIGAKGKPWSVKMKHHYGYLKKTSSEADGDHLDVFVGPNPESEIVFIIDQTKADGETFDEHKCMIGWTNADDAKQAYLDNYSAGWKGFASITAMPMSTFKEWIANGDTGCPIEDQAISLSAATQPADRSSFDPDLADALDEFTRQWGDGRQVFWNQKKHLLWVACPDDDKATSIAKMVKDAKSISGIDDVHIEPESSPHGEGWVSWSYETGPLSLQLSASLFDDLAHPRGDTSCPIEDQAIALSGAWDESQHPRGQDGNPGEFAEKSKRKHLAGETEKRAADIKFTDRVIGSKQVGRRDYDDIEAAMTSQETKDMEEWLKDAKATVIDEQLSEFDPDISRDTAAYAHRKFQSSAIEDDIRDLIKEHTEYTEDEEAAIEAMDGAITGELAGDAVRQAKEAIEKAIPEDPPVALIKSLDEYADRLDTELDVAYKEAKEAEIDVAREDANDKYDSSEDKAEYLRSFWDKNPDRFTEISPLNTWHKDADGDDALRFETAKGIEYFVNVVNRKKEILGMPVIEAMFSQGDNTDPANFKITGSGSAHEVLGKVAAAINAYVKTKNPPLLVFSAKEESRRRLYDRMVKNLAAAFPAYSALAIAGENRMYALVKREKRDEAEKAFREQPEAKGIPVETLVLSAAGHWALSASLFDDLAHPRGDAGRFTFKPIKAEHVKAAQKDFAKDKLSVKRSDEPIVSDASGASIHHYVELGGEEPKRGGKEPHEMTQAEFISANLPKISPTSVDKATVVDDNNSAGAKETPGAKAGGGKMVATVKMVHGRVQAGKPANFTRKGKNAAEAGEVFTAKSGSRYVVTSTDTYYVSDDQIDDNDDWAKYPDGPGHYTSFTAVPVEPTAEESAEDAAAAKKKQDDADAVIAKKDATDKAWSAVADHDVSFELPPGLGNLNWALVGDDRTKQPMGYYGTVKEIATLPDGSKIGKLISSGYDDYRESYYLPKNLADAGKFDRAIRLGRTLDENKKLAASDNYYAREAKDFLDAYEKASPEQRSRYEKNAASMAAVNAAPKDQQWAEIKRHYRDTGRFENRSWMPDGARSEFDSATHRLTKEIENAAGQSDVLAEVNRTPGITDEINRAALADDPLAWGEYVKATVTAAKEKASATTAAKRKSWAEWYKSAEPKLADAISKVVPMELVPQALDFVRAYNGGEGASPDWQKENAPEKWAADIRRQLLDDDGEFTAESHPELHAHGEVLRAAAKEKEAERKKQAKDAKKSAGGKHVVIGNSFPHKDKIKALGGKWDGKQWTIPADMSHRLPRGLSSRAI